MSFSPSPSPPAMNMQYDAAGLDPSLANATGPEIDAAIKQAQYAAATGEDAEDGFNVAMDIEEDDEDDETAPQSGEPANQGAAQQEGSDEEEEEEDDEDGDDAAPSDQRPKKRRKRKEGASRFLDLEVEVDTDDEEEEDEDDALPADFIVERGARKGSADIDEDEPDPDDQQHRQLDRNRQKMDDRKAEDVARELDERNRERRRRQAEAASMTDSMLPRNAIMPDVNDPTIWGLRVKRGREREIVMSIFRKAVANDLSIASAFSRDSIEGFVYVEARFEAHVRAACHGIVGVYANTTLLLVPLEERPDLLRTKKKEVKLQENGWVRLKRGKYAGDLAQITEISESGAELTLRYIPRIDHTPREKDVTVGSDGKKRKKGAGGSAAISFRPPAAFFNADAVKRAYGSKSIKVTNRQFQFGNDIYVGGYLVKEHNLNSLVVEDVNPTIDEITAFAGEKGANEKRAGEDEDEEEDRDKTGVDFNIIAEAQRKAAHISLRPGDNVEVYEGDQKGLEGVVESVANNIVTLMPSEFRHPELAGRKIEVPSGSVRKRFKVGDHIKVLAGTNVDQTGLILHIDRDTLTFVSDLDQKPVQVFSKDVREAAEVGAGVNVVGAYELHDLVQLDATTSGVIFKTERDMFRVLDQTGTVRTLKPAQISGKIDSSRTIATDSEGVDIRPGDMVKELGSAGTGGHEGRTGRILHVYRSLFAFLHNREIIENGGVFVVSVRYLTSMAPKNVGKPATDLSKMNPAVGAMAPPSAPPAGAGAARRTGRDPIEGLKEVYVLKGPYKGHKGTIKDVNAMMVRIELDTSSKLVTIERAKLGKESGPAKQRIPIDRWVAEQRGGGAMRPMPMPNGAYAGAGAFHGSQAGSPFAGAGTPAAFGGGRTPNPYAAASGAGGGRTPNPYAAGAAVGGGKTPNPYAAVPGGRTPNPYASGVGGRTPNPHAAGVGGKTPNPYTDGSRTPAYGESNDDAWNPSSQSSSAAGSVWDPSAKTPYTSNDDRAGASGSGTTPRYGGTTPASIGTGGYGNFQPASSTPRDSYGGRSSYGGSSERRDDYGGSSAGGRREEGSRYGTATNTMALGAPSRYGARDGAPTPATGAPTPGGYGNYDSGNTPYGAPTPAPRTPYDARTPYTVPTPGQPYSAPTPAAGPDTYYRGAPTPAANGPTPGPSHSHPTPRNDAYASAPTPAAYGTPRDFPQTPHDPYGSSGNYATPYGGQTPYASTPAASGGGTAPQGADNDAFVPPDWPEVGLQVRIVRDADNLASFAGARFDDSQAIIVMVPPHRPYEENTVNLRLYDPYESQAPNVTLPPVPIRFLEPCKPTRVEERAVVIATGANRHARVTTKSPDDTAWLCALDTGGQAVFERKMLCLFAGIGGQT